MSNFQGFSTCRRLLGGLQESKKSEIIRNLFISPETIIMFDTGPFGQCLGSLGHIYCSNTPKRRFAKDLPSGGGADGRSFANRRFGVLEQYIGPNEPKHWPNGPISDIMIVSGLMKTFLMISDFFDSFAPPSCGLQVEKS